MTNPDGANKVQQLPTIRVEDDLWAMIQKDVAESFEGLPEIVRRRLRLGYGEGESPLVKSAAQELRERKEELAIEKLEREAAIDRKEMIRVDEVCEVVSKDYAEIRQEVLSIPQAASIELGLNEDQVRGLAALINSKVMTKLSGELQETYDAIAAK